MNISAQPTLAATLWPDQASGLASLTRKALLVALGTLALIISAKVQVPFWPVPMTLQTLVVLTLAAALGTRLSVLTVGAYLLEGALGLPVFAGTPEKGLGLFYMAGPTGGYLVGFLLAAALIGYGAERGWDRTLPRLLALMSLGHIVIFAAGFIWMAQLFGASLAWSTGVAPFIATSIVKTVLAAAVLAGTWKLVARLRG
jgi:biotin transport system substrate-specific component